MAVSCKWGTKSSGFVKRLAEDLLSSQEEVCSMEFFCSLYLLISSSLLWFLVYWTHCFFFIRLFLFACKQSNGNKTYLPVSVSRTDDFTQTLGYHTNLTSGISLVFRDFCYFGKHFLFLKLKCLKTTWGKLTSKFNLLSATVNLVDKRKYFVDAVKDKALCCIRSD